MKTITIGFLGMGTVGSGAYEIIRSNGKVIEHRDELCLKVKKALVRNVEKTRGNGIPKEILTTDPDEVLNDPEIDIVAEFLGGVEPAKTYLLKALQNGKTVVTANKIVLANCWPELEQAAKDSGAGLYYEATVAGGIPIIRTIHCAMQANRINKIMGIINGTTNYILSAMTKEGKDYEEVLKQAQKIGLAEADPTLDVGGMDAAFKLSILSSIAFHSKIPVDHVYTEGITKVTAQDIQIGKEMGLTLKLLAIGKRRGQEVEVRVHPTFIPDEHPLAKIDGATNAIYLHGDAVGDVMLSGQGAGGLPTGSAVVSDIVYAAKQTVHQYATFVNRDVPPSDLLISNDWKTEYYVAILAPDRPGVLSAVAGIFAKNGVSIASMIQKSTGEERVPVIFLTHKSGEQSLERAVKEISEIEDMTVRSTIRVEGLDD